VKAVGQIQTMVYSLSANNRSTRKDSKSYSVLNMNMKYFWSCF